MDYSPYVLVTPARNEEATIGITIESVVAQTVLPVEWIIVSDHSTDRTDEIVQHYQSMHCFIRLLRSEGCSERSFSSVVHATEAGVRAIGSKNYEFIGLLDADVRLGRKYYETLVGRFLANPKLGLAGGLVLDIVNGRQLNGRQYLGDVAGATQFFRRECFQSLGGLVAIPEGGWDAITCLQARSNGYITATFPDLVVEHLKPRNVSGGNVFRRNWQLGVRDYALGGHPIFELAKCIYRISDHPPVIGAALRMSAFFWSTVTKRRRTIGFKILEAVRQEQARRLTKRLFPRRNNGPEDK